MSYAVGSPEVSNHKLYKNVLPVNNNAANNNSAMQNPDNLSSGSTMQNPDNASAGNSSEEGLSLENMGANVQKEVNDLKRACDKHNSIELRNFDRMVPSFTDLHKDYHGYLSEPEKKRFLDLLRTEVDNYGQLTDVHDF
jgi:hypothetical protein